MVVTGSILVRVKQLVQHYNGYWNFWAKKGQMGVHADRRGQGEAAAPHSITSIRNIMDLEDIQLWKKFRDHCRIISFPYFAPSKHVFEFCFIL